MALVDPKIKEFLGSLGLSEKEVSVYLSALKLGNALVKDIAKLAMLNRTTAYNLLLGLRKQGLVASYTKSSLIYFSAVSPDRLRDLITKRIEDQQKLKGIFESFRPELNALFQSKSKGAKIQIFDGLDGLNAIYWGLYEDAQAADEGLEITNWGGKYNLFPESLRKELAAFLKKKNVSVRSLLVEDELTKSWASGTQPIDFKKSVQFMANPGWDFFTNIEVFQNKIALVTYRDDVDFQGVLIENREMATVFKFMFETMWGKKGSPSTSSGNTI